MGDTHDPADLGVRHDAGSESHETGQDHWVDSAVMEQRIRPAQADPALSRELAELFPDTLADR